MSKIINTYANKPWMLWLLVAIARQEKRQEWTEEVHASIQRHKLGRTGTVPDNPEWKFDYHGKGLMLNGPNNECLDVDFHHDKTELVDPYFFTQRILNLAIPEGPEERLKFWLPEDDMIVHTIRLLQADSILSPQDSHVFRLHPKHEWDKKFFIESSFETLLHAIEGSIKNRPVHQSNYTEWLLEQCNSEKTSPSAFTGFARCLPLETRIFICESRLNAVDRKAAAAVKVLSEIAGFRSEKVSNLLAKLNPQKHHPYIAHSICSYLLPRNIDHLPCIEILEAFANQRVVEGYLGNPYDYDLALLLLRFNPVRAIPVLRLALRSSTPDSARRTAALMWSIGTHWSDQELINVINESDVSKKKFVSIALFLSKDSKARQIGFDNLPSRIREELKMDSISETIPIKERFPYFNYAIENAQEDLKFLDLEAIERGISEKPWNVSKGSD